MTQYHVLLACETGEEFSITCDATDVEECETKIRNNYPESCILEISDPAAVTRREQRLLTEDDDDDDQYIEW